MGSPRANLKTRRQNSDEQRLRALTRVHRRLQLPEAKIQELHDVLALQAYENAEALQKLGKWRLNLLTLAAVACATPQLENLRSDDETRAHEAKFGPHDPLTEFLREQLPHGLIPSNVASTITACAPAANSFQATTSLLLRGCIHWTRLSWRPTLCRVASELRCYPH